MKPHVIALFVLSLTAAACSSGSPEPAQAPRPAGRQVDAATAGSITGQVTLTGTSPAVEKIRMASDPACVEGAGPNPQSDAVLVGDGGSLQNVFVYIKSGLDPSYTFDSPTSPVVLDQKGCVYKPRVLGVRVSQPVTISNDDATFHNVHALPKTNQEFNQGLANRNAKMTKTFTAPEVMVRFKCDVHGWMAAYVGVVAHPYFAVTGADGSFSLTGVPPGTYIVEAWHERFGTKSTEVTVGDHQPRTVAFSFAGN